MTDTEGWELESSLRALLAEKERDGLRIEWVRKGTDKSIDAYSAFSDASSRPPLDPGMTVADHAASPTPHRTSTRSSRRSLSFSLQAVSRI